MTIAIAAGYATLEEFEEAKLRDKIAAKVEKDKNKVKGLTSEGRKRISDRYVVFKFSVVSLFPSLSLCLYLSLALSLSLSISLSLSLCLFLSLFLSLCLSLSLSVSVSLSLSLYLSLSLFLSFSLTLSFSLSHTHTHSSNTLFKESDGYFKLSNHFKWALDQVRICFY